MATNEPKKWRKDYAILLQSWAMTMTSKLIKQMARDQMKQLDAEDKAINRLKSFIEKNQFESMSLFNQINELWKKSSKEFMYQKNYNAAAECLEQLSEVQWKYGSDTEKLEASNTLDRASNLYKSASNSKQAIIAKNRAQALLEFSSNEDKTTESLSKKQKSSSSICDLNQPMPSTSFGPISTGVRMSEQHIRPNFLDVLKRKTIVENDEIDDKSLVWKQIKQMSEKACPKANISDTSDSNEDNTEDSDESISKYPSNGLLRQNLRNILSNNSKETEDTSDITTDESPPKHRDISVQTIDKQNVMTTQITAVPLAITPTETTPTVSIPSVERESQQNSKRKRRTKPKEKSEELPENRLLKLSQKNIEHYFVVDQRNPLKRLLCEVCKESVLSYRWSTITDHLNTNKHKNKCLPYNMIDIFNSYNNNQNYYIHQNGVATDFDNNSYKIANQLSTAPLASTSGNISYSTCLTPDFSLIFSETLLTNEPTINESGTESLRTPQMPGYHL